MVTPALPCPPAPAGAAICYPESDGQPAAETDVHRALMFALIGMLQAFFRDDPHVYISGNLFVYYQEGNPRRVVAPDVFVVQGVRNHARRVYKLWEEGVPPAVVFELTSHSTRGEDRRRKYDLYERLGVTEYFLFDPLGEYLRPPCRGYRLRQGQYRPLAPAADGSLWSAVLGLALHERGEQLRLYDPADQRWLPTPPEEATARRAAEERASVEAAARRAAEERALAAESQRAAAEAEVARLRALLSSRGQSS